MARRTASLRGLAFVCLAAVLIWGSAGIISAQQSEQVSGEWSLLSEGCWALEDDTGQTHSLSPVPGLDLNPRQGWKVTLTASGISQSAGCAGEALVIDGVVKQQGVEVEQFTDQSGAKSALSNIVMIIVAAGVVAVLVVVITDEGVKYQTLAAAARPLSKRSRTTEAAFLRGRIVGFLSSNQGLHFSAIAASFSMGNHQAAHHLSILEREGHVWKRRDGRRLRFYTVDVAAVGDVDSLPAPREVPAAGSMPARLLDYIEAVEHGVHRPSSQKQIAVALKTSQQLVSHHMRMMQRSGWIIVAGGRRNRALALSETGREVLTEIRRMQMSG